jgi:transketolase
MRRAFINTLLEIAATDDRICLIVGDLGYSVVEPFAEAFPDRFLNVGVAEQNMISVAAGWSMAENKVVFCYSIANFPVLRCLEQIRNDVCYHRANVKIVSVGGGLTYGTAGFTHHGVEDLAVMKAMPNMVVAAPADAAEASSVVDLAVQHEGPFYIRLGKNGEASIHDKNPALAIGQPILHTAQGEIVVISTGTIISECLMAAQDLSLCGIKTCVVGIPVLKPLDEQALALAVESAKAILTVEEHTLVGGLGSSIATIMARQGIKIPLSCLGLPGIVDRVGTQEYLRAYYELDRKSIYKKVLELAINNTDLEL